jgi:hypothetical protein
MASMGRTRFASSAPRPGGEPSFKQNWLSDPSTYPTIGIVSGAMVAAFGFIGYKVMYCPNVRVTSACKGKIIRTWS